jgi:hypothetical protein
VLDLERSDIDAVVDASLADRFGAHRAQPGRATMELRLTSGAEALPAGFRVVATTDPLTPSQRADRTRLIAQIPGLDPNATAAERLQFFAAHRDLIPLAHELDKIPDLPVLTLIAASLPQHP